MEFYGLAFVCRSYILLEWRRVVVGSQEARRAAEDGEQAAEIPRPTFLSVSRGVFRVVVERAGAGGEENFIYENESRSLRLFHGQSTRFALLVHPATARARAIFRAVPPSRHFSLCFRSLFSGPGLTR